MSILGAIIEPFMGTMFCPFAHLLNGFRITSQFVGHDYSWLGIGVQKACQEANSGFFVTAFLQQHIQLKTILIHGTP